MSRDGVSRLSAYHRFGMISPFLVARELAHNPSNGARKLLDEFLTWRELAYIWCFHHLPTSNLFAVRAPPFPLCLARTSTCAVLVHWMSPHAAYAYILVCACVWERGWKRGGEGGGMEGKEGGREMEGGRDRDRGRGGIRQEGLLDSVALETIRCIPCTDTA